MMSTLTFHALQPPIQAILTPAQRADATNDNHEPDRPMDFDEERGIWIWRYRDGRGSPRMVSIADIILNIIYDVIDMVYAMIS